MSRFIKQHKALVAASTLALIVLSVVFAAGPSLLSAQAFPENNPPTPPDEFTGVPGLDANATGLNEPAVYTPPNYVELPPNAAPTGPTQPKAADKPDTPQVNQPGDPFSCLWPPSFRGCMALLIDSVMWLAARALWMTGVLFNITIDYTLNLNTLLEKMPIVDIGWKVLRDLSNIFFIFITLWCGINITLGIDGGKKAWHYLAEMVLVALFINFSLFIAKAVVDASNVAALHFYSLIVEPGQEHNWDKGLSEAYLYGLKLGTLYNVKSLGANVQAADKSIIGGINNRGRGGELSFTNIILIGFFGTVFIITTAWVFLMAAFMFMWRAITLIMLMMLSPLAFIGLLLPGAHGVAHEWWHKLWSQAFFAPLYMALAYIVVRTINSKAFAEGMWGMATGEGGAQGVPVLGFAAAITGTGSQSVAVVFNFVILIGLMVGCLIVAEHLGAKGSDTAMAGWEKIKGGAIGVAGATLRGGIKAPAATLRGLGDTIGGKSKVGKWMASSRLLNNKLFSVKSMQESGLGKVTSKAAEVLSKATDVRFLEERASQSKWGNTTIGKGLRAATIGGIANLKIGEKSLQEAHEEGEKQETARHIIGLIAEQRQAGKKLQPLWHDQDTYQEEKEKAAKAVEAKRQKRKEAEERPLTPDQQKAVEAAQKELNEAKVIPPERQGKIEEQQKKIEEQKKLVARAKLVLENNPESQTAKDNVAQQESELDKQKTKLKELEMYPKEQQVKIDAATQKLEAAKNALSPEDQQKIADIQKEIEALKAGTSDQRKNLKEQEDGVAKNKALRDAAQKELAGINVSDTGAREAKQKEIAELDEQVRGGQTNIENYKKRRDSDNEPKVKELDKKIKAIQHPPPTKEQQEAQDAAKNVADKELAEAEEDLKRATVALEKFQKENGAKIAQLVAERSHAFAGMSAQEFIHYATKEDKKRMDFESDPPGHFLAVMEDEHVTEVEKEDATHHYVHRLMNEARRGEGRNERFNQMVVDFQKKFGRNEQMMMRFRREIGLLGLGEQLKKIESEIQELEERKAAREKEMKE